mgnify:CR=1 FL=1
MSSSLAGRSVIVTGGSKGIGKGIARVFGKAGAKVLVVSRNHAEAEGAAEEIRRAGGTAKGFAADVSDAGGTQLMAEAAHAAFGGIDVLCANAGIFPQAKIEDLSAEDWDHVMSTNLKGTFLSLKSCLPYLRKSDQPRVKAESCLQG